MEEAIYKGVYPPFFVTKRRKGQRGIKQLMDSLIKVMKGGAISQEVLFAW